MEAACCRHVVTSTRLREHVSPDAHNRPSTSASTYVRTKSDPRSRKSSFQSLHASSAWQQDGFGDIAEDALFRQRWNGDCDGPERWQILRTRAAQVEGAVADPPTPTASLIDGKSIAAKIRQEIADEVTAMKAATGQVPGLAVLLVGSRKDSQTYVRSKKRACQEVGIESYGVDLPGDCTEEEVLEAVEGLNGDERVHGVLVQLPLPKHMNEERVLSGVSLQKDVDGFHPLNIGRLAMTGREPLFVPCTPSGCVELLLREGVELQGKRAVVVGRSNVVGMPAALLLQRHNCTVTVIHSQTPNPEAICREADIVIAAVGVANLVRGSWLKPGAVVIDVGINAVEDPNDPRGYHLEGDVCFEEAKNVASKITPVPGGVGPMTIAMLLKNTLVSARRAYGLESA